MKRLTLAILAALALSAPAHADAPGTTVPGIYEPQATVTVSVTTSATLLATSIISGTTFCITNNDPSKTLYTSWNSSVTTSGATKGRPMPPGSPFCFNGVAKGYTLYGIGTAGTTEVAVEEFRRR